MDLKKYDTMLRRVAWNLSRNIPQGSFDDLVQEGMIALWSKSDQVLCGKSEDEVMALATRIAKLSMIDWIRRMWPIRNKFGLMVGSKNVDDEESFAYEMFCPDIVHSFAKVSQLISRLESLIKSSESKEAAKNQLRVLDCLIDGMSGVEISQYLNLAERTVSIHKSAIREKTLLFIDH